MTQFILKQLWKQSSGPSASMKTWGMPSKGQCNAFEEVQFSFQTILPFFSCIQKSCWKTTVFNQHTDTHAIFHLWKFQRNMFNSETTIFHSQAVVFLWDNTAFFQEAVTRFLCRFGTSNFAGLGDQGIQLYLMQIAYRCILVGRLPLYSSSVRTFRQNLPMFGQ